MVDLIQPSFARGEIGPDLYGRVDVAAYRVALRTALNVVIHAYGGVSNRPGLMYVGPCMVHSGTPPEIIEFKFNTEDTYILEFGHQKMRVIRNDAHVLNAPKTITAATQADPVVLTINSHGFSNGQDIYVAGIVGMTELNNRWFTVANATTNTFSLKDQQTQTDIDSSAYTAYASGGEAYAVYELETPYDIEHVWQIKHVQSANVMTLTHPLYAPRKLSRNDHDDWTLELIAFAPAQPYPESLSGSVNVGTGTNYYYQVTAINAETQEESIPAIRNDNKAITGITQADPAVVTSASHGFSNGNEIELSEIVGMTELNGRRFEVQNVTTNTYELVGVDSTGYSAYVSGGRADRTFVILNSGTTPDNTITFSAAEGANRYSIYREENGLYGWIGDTEDLSFVDKNIEADLTLSPPQGRNPFLIAGDFPGVVSYYEQRRVFGATVNKPDTAWYSVTGSQDNMSQSSPRKPDDAITATLNSLEVNEIRALVPMNDLLILTSGSEWRVNSGQEAAFTAENLRQKPQSNWGCSHLRPIVVGDKVLFVTENETYIRSIGYEIAIDGYKGNDMTVFAPHIFRDGKCIQWSFSRWPDPLVICIREDGIAPVMTFNPEQEVIAFARWKTDGKFLKVACIRANADEVDTAPYFVVERRINGQSAYYIERIKSRRFKDIRDCFFVDSGLSLDAPVDISGVSAEYPITVSAVAHGFIDGDFVDIDDIVWEPTFDEHFNEQTLDQLNGRRFLVASKTTDTFKLVNVDGRKDITAVTNADPAIVTSESHGLANGTVIGIFDVAGMTELNGKVFKVASATADTYKLTDLNDADIDSTGYGTYTSGGVSFPAWDGSEFNTYLEGGKVREAITTVSNLWHLEGEEVVILADGNVVENKVVTDGSITLPQRSSRVHVGLRYVSDIQTLDPELSGTESIQGKKKRVVKSLIRMKDARGLLVGPNQNKLQEMKQRQFENYGQPTQLLTGDRDIVIPSDWNGGGRVFLRQIYPLPLTITAIVLDLDIGSDG
jgi:hypothetical protein